MLTRTEWLSQSSERIIDASGRLRAPTPLGFASSDTVLYEFGAVLPGYRIRSSEFGIRVARPRIRPPNSAAFACAFGVLWRRIAPMIPHFSSHLASVDRRMVTAVFRVALSLLLLLCVSRFAVSQFEIGAVRGTVSNSTGAPIKEVVVTARTSDSKFSVTATTDESGAYAFSNLPPGTITLLARMPGLQVIYSGLAFPIRQYESWQQNFLMNPASSITLSGS